MGSRTHWDEVYEEKEPTEVSWYQAEPTLSVGLIGRVLNDRASPIIDVGGGASTLVDHLLAAGYSEVSVLDLSAHALAQAAHRLGDEAARVTWLQGDVLDADLPGAGYDFWHDRAVFHFLTDPDDRCRYVAQVHRAVRVGGHVAVATFASDGPTHCSGLEVSRYDPVELHAEFGTDFRLVESLREEHVTPWGAVQPFTYCLCRVSG